MSLATRLSLAVAAAACIGLVVTPPASAKPFEHETFHEEFDTVGDCGDGLVLEFHDVMDGRVLVVPHGDGYLYETRHWTLTAVTTVPGTDLTLTVVNKGLVTHDVKATPNGDGTITVNKRTAQEYFRRATLEALLGQPFRATQTEGRYDVMVRALGGGVSGQAGAVRHGIAKALIIADPELRIVDRDGRPWQAGRTGYDHFA